MKLSFCGNLFNFIKKIKLHKDQFLYFVQNNFFNSLTTLNSCSKQKTTWLIGIERRKTINASLPLEVKIGANNKTNSTTA